MCSAFDASIIIYNVSYIVINSNEASASRTVICACVHMQYLCSGSSDIALAIFLVRYDFHPLHPIFRCIWPVDAVGEQQFHAFCRILQLQVRVPFFFVRLYKSCLNVYACRPGPKLCYTYSQLGQSNFWFHDVQLATIVLSLLRLHQFLISWRATSNNSYVTTLTTPTVTASNSSRWSSIILYHRYYCLLTFSFTLPMHAPPVFFVD